LRRRDGAGRGARVRIRAGLRARLRILASSCLTELGCSPRWPASLARPVTMDGPSGCRRWFLQH
jgi:hypothetical protein